MVLSVGDRDLGKDSSSYQYRAYFMNMVTYSNSEKTSTLQGHGFYEDSWEQMEAVPVSSTGASGNGGFDARRRLFFDDTKQEDTISSKFKRFCFPIYTELHSMDTPILPGTSLKLVLDQAKETWPFMQNSLVTGSYKFQLHNPTLYVKIAVLFDKTYQTIKGMLEKEKKILMVYRRNEVLHYTITSGRNDFTTPSLFSRTVPAKIHVVFVEGDAFNGSKYWVSTSSR